jgi:MFS family permease
MGSSRSYPYSPEVHGRGWQFLILAVLVIAELNSAFEVGIMYGIFGTLVREFRDPIGAGWLITAFLLVGAASAALGSRLGDLYGRRRGVLVKLTFATCGSMISATSASLSGLIGFCHDKGVRFSEAAEASAAQKARE